MGKHRRLLQVVRGRVIESEHFGSIAIVRANGSIEWEYGNIDTITFTRSALKPFQLLPSMLGGTCTHFQFTDEEIAVSCASHNGESIHVSSVRNILQKANISESLLQCGSHVPALINAQGSLESVDREVLPLHNNCSGKHATMLATCSLQGYDLSSYLDINHPLQLEIKNIFSEITGISSDNFGVGIDGCGAPNYATSLKTIAQAFAWLASPVGSEKLVEATKRITGAMSQAPYYVSGKARADLIISQMTKARVISKVGAEGLMALAIPEKGLGIAIKSADGSQRPNLQIAACLLNSLGLIHSLDWRAALKSPIKNCTGKEVGYTEVALEESFGARH